MDIAQAIREMEAQVGRISPVQKFLLGTDGSVTQLLESITGKRVVIKTLLQKEIPADRTAADNLSIAEGDPVNFRIVEIRTEENGEVLIYAISHTPVNRLSPEFRDDLMKADIPIGRIINQHHIEARREILSTRVLPATEEAGRLFSICRNEPLLSRQYQIIHAGKPLIFIEEQFPYNRFLDTRRVIIRTPSRVHVTLIDMHGGSGRVDGGIGITLDEPGDGHRSGTRTGYAGQRLRSGSAATDPVRGFGCAAETRGCREHRYHGPGTLPVPCRAWQRVAALACRGTGSQRTAWPPPAGERAGPACRQGRDLRYRSPQRSSTGVSSSMAGTVLARGARKPTSARLLHRPASALHR